MATEVELPQLGESVTEGVITAWLVSVGDEVTVDQPIVEISTDKVDTEIPSPVAGVIQELRAEVDDTIEVGQVIAVVGDTAQQGGATTDDQPDQADQTGTTDQDGQTAPTDTTDQDGQTAPTDTSGDTADEDQPATGTTTGGDTDATSAETADGTTGAPVLTSPLVRKLLREAGLSPTQVRATGPGGRLTRDDAERAIASGGERAPAAAEGDDGGRESTGTPAAANVTPPPAVIAAPGERSRPPASPTQVEFAGEREVTQDITRVRKAIARSMMNSLQTTAQLTAAVEVDLTAVMNLRAAKKDAFRAKEGTGLSPLALISRAACMVIPRHPVLNSSMDMESGTATFHNYVNLGMAVDTERGLLVPNIKDAQDLTAPGLARRIGDLAARARNKKLQPDEIAGGTFTITNTGSVGTLFDTPILNPPQVAILATCAVEKRPVVVSDAYGDSIAIRWMSYFCLSYDHRMVDGADAARFLQDLKFVLETHDFSAELGV